MNLFINVGIIFKIFIFSLFFLYIPVLTYGNISSDLTNLVGKNAKESKNLIIYNDYHIVYSYFPENKEYWWKKKDKECVSIIINDGKIENFLQISNRKCESAAALLRKNGLDYHIGSAPVRNKVLEIGRAHV